MIKEAGDMVHPWYKGNHEWKVKCISHLDQPVEYHDEQQGDVKYDPRIFQLEAPTGCSVLWFNYWISTKKTNGKMKWGGKPPVLEEFVLLELMKNAIKSGLFSKDFLSALVREIEVKLSASRP
jgi:hypothetical protein